VREAAIGKSHTASESISRRSPSESGINDERAHDHRRDQIADGAEASYAPQKGIRAFVRAAGQLDPTRRGSSETVDPARVAESDSRRLWQRQRRGGMKRSREL